MSNAGPELETAATNVVGAGRPSDDMAPSTGVEAEVAASGPPKPADGPTAPGTGEQPGDAAEPTEIGAVDVTAEPVEADSAPAEPAGERTQAGEADGSSDAGEDSGTGQPTASGPSNRPDLDDPDLLRAALESVLFIADAPVTITALATGLQRPMPDIQAALAALASDLDQRGSGIELREIGEGVRLYTRPQLAGWIEAFLMDGQRVRLTQAALETLAVIAYRQPVTRARISAIRGVNVDGVVRTLITRGLITEVGADPDTGGGLYRTTELFLEKMGLRSLDELPSLAPLLPELTGLESDELSG